jgi:hypothetical protein
MGSGINTAFPLGAKGENGFEKLAEASPPSPDFGSSAEFVGKRF